MHMHNHLWLLSNGTFGWPKLFLSLVEDTKTIDCTNTPKINLKFVAKL